MLTLEPMQKVRVVCTHARVEAVVHALYRFGGIEVTRCRHGTPGLPLSSFQQISEELIALRAMESALKIIPSVEARMPPSLEKLFSHSSELRAEYGQVGQVLTKIDSLRSEQARLQQEKKLLEPLRNLRAPPSIFSKTQKISFYFGELKTAEKELAEGLKSLPAEVSFASGQGKRHALVAYSPDNSKIGEVLAKNFSSKLEIPAVSQKSFGQALSSVEQRLSAASQEEKKLRAQVEKFSAGNASRISQLRADLEEHAKQAELSNKFGKTDFLETIEGWLPFKHYAQLQAALGQATGGNVFVEKIATSEKAPSVLSNPRVMRRFEFLLTSFSLPDPNELDPTVFVAITYPIIFGMIFGDIGYGILTALLGVLLRVRMQGLMRDMGGMMILSAAWTIFFGFVFGEFFGGEQMLGFRLTPLIRRSGEGIALLFGVTLLVGVIHLALGFIIGVASNLRAKHYGHAWAKLLWLVIEAGMVAGIYSIVFKQPSLQLPAMAALLIGIAGLYKFEGIAGLVELPGLLANGLSYLRIMALGLSGVIIAMIVNQIPLNSALATLAAAFSGSFNPVSFATSLLTVLLLALLIAFGHGLALGLGIFESGIQTLRLHYVEFFSKFYKGGGTPFIPLREKRV